MLRRITDEERGVSAVIVALVLVVLLGFATLVVDAGVLFEQRRQLQNAVDAAALAGAQQIATDVTQTTEQAYIYAEVNGVTRSEIVQNGIVTIFNTGDGVTVKARRQVNLFFARVLGTSFEFAEAQATAILTKIEPSDIWPWGITRDTIGTGLTVLKLGAPDSTAGNYMALDFPASSGASSYGDYIQYGYCPTSDPNPCPVPADISETNPWVVYSEPGNVVGDTIQGVSYLLGQTSTFPLNDIRNPRIGLVPILRDPTWEEAQGKTPVEIVGFAVFYLEGVEEGPPGQANVYGTFLPLAYGVGRSTNVGGSLEGLVGARLWQ